VRRTLVIPKRKSPPRGERIRVMPGVLGDVMIVHDDGSMVVHVKIADVVRALERALLGIELRSTGPGASG
jgi:hypothetical protein